MPVRLSSISCGTRFSFDFAFSTCAALTLCLSSRPSCFRHLPYIPIAFTDLVVRLESGTVCWACPAAMLAAKTTVINRKGFV